MERVKAWGCLRSLGVWVDYLLNIGLSFRKKFGLEVIVYA